MAANEQTIRRNDTPEFQFTFVDTDGTATDLTNATEVRWIAKDICDQGMANVDAQFNVTCTIDSPATLGIARVTLTAANTNLAGEYQSEVQITFTGPSVLTPKSFKLNIEADIVL